MICRTLSSLPFTFSFASAPYIQQPYEQTHKGWPGPPPFPVSQSSFSPPSVLVAGRNNPRQSSIHCTVRPRFAIFYIATVSPTDRSTSSLSCRRFIQLFPESLPTPTMAGPRPVILLAPARHGLARRREHACPHDLVDEAVHDAEYLSC